MNNRYSYSYTSSNGETRVIYSESHPYDGGTLDTTYSPMTSGYSQVTSILVESTNDKEEEENEVHV